MSTGVEALVRTVPVARADARSKQDRPLTDKVRRRSCLVTRDEDKSPYRQSGRLGLVRARARSREVQRARRRGGRGERGRTAEWPRKGRETCTGHGRKSVEERAGERKKEERTIEGKQEAKRGPRVAGGGTETRRKKEDLPTSCEPGNVRERPPRSMYSSIDKQTLVEA